MMSSQSITNNKLWRFMWLLVWSVALTFMTGFLGAAPLYGARLVGNKKWYFTAIAIVNVGIYLLGFPFVALSYLSFVALIESYEWISNKSESLFVSGVFSIIFSSFFVLISGYTMKVVNPSLWSTAYERIIENFKKAVDINKQLNLKVDDFWQQAPSVLVIFLGMALFCALYFNQKKSLIRSIEKKTKYWFLTSFRVPSVFIWLLLSSFAVTFLDHGMKDLSILGMNVFNILIFAYFLQGTAVLTSLFAVIRMSLLWKYIILFFIVVNLFFLVAAIGVIDFWVDFRSIIAKKIKEKLS